MSWETESVALDAVFIDRSCDYDIDVAGFPVNDGTLQSSKSRTSGFCRGLSEIYFYLLGCAGHQIQAVFHCLGNAVHRGVVGREVECLAVVRSHLGRTVDDWGAQLQHCWVCKRLENHLIAYPVWIAVRDTNSYLFCFNHIYDF